MYIVPGSVADTVRSDERFTQIGITVASDSMEINDLIAYQLTVPQDWGIKHRQHRHEPSVNVCDIVDSEQQVRCKITYDPAEHHDSTKSSTHFCSRYALKSIYDKKARISWWSIFDNKHHETAYQPSLGGQAGKEDCLERLRSKGIDDIDDQHSWGIEIEYVVYKEG